MCGTPSIAPSVSLSRIVGGEEATANSWPWQCYIRMDLGGGWYGECGGSVIGDTYILSAAHCLYAYAVGSLRLQRAVYIFYE